MGPGPDQVGSGRQGGGGGGMRGREGKEKRDNEIRGGIEGGNIPG